MAKGSKKKKEKKKDFQKVKLKVGKKIPKSLNATETAFKSRAILLKKQLRKDFKGPETKRKLNIQELLSHLQHYNVNVRLDGTSGLRELLNHHPNLIRENLSLLVGGIAAAFIDRDPGIRKAIVALIQIITTNVSSKEILPFFPIMSAHLGCAMTHINDEIRIDALKILDVYLEKYPELVTTSSHQILEKFLSLISQKGTEYKSESGTIPNFLRTLTVNPSSKLSRQKWRMAVLTRLGKFLKVLTNTATPKDSSSSVKDLVWGNGHYSVTTFLYGGTEPYNENYFRLRRGLASNNTKSRKREMTDGVLFIDTLIPLLFDCWTETISFQDGSNVSPQSSSMMCIVIDVMLHIVYYLKQLTKDADNEGNLWMKAEQQRHILQLFFARFPYVVYENLNKIKRKNKFKVELNEETSEKVSSVQLNTSVAELMCLLLDPKLRHTLDGQLLKEKLSKFLSKALLNGQNDEGGDLKRTLKIVELFIKLPLEDGIIQEISSAAYNCFNKCQASSASKQHILEAFCSLQLSYCFSQSDKTPSWLTLLPKTVLSTPTKYENLNTLFSLMHVAAAQGDENFLSALLIELPHFIEKLPKFSSSQQKTVFDFLHFAPRVENELYIKLTKWSRSGNTDIVAIRYLLQILHCRFVQQLKYGEEWTKPEYYINWLVSMLIGCDTSKFRPNSSNLCDIQKWPFENAISQNIVLCVCQLPNEEQVQDSMTEQIRYLLGSCLHTTLLTQLAVIQFFTSLSSLSDMNLLFVGQVCSEALIALVGMDYNGARDRHLCNSALEVCWRLCVKFKVTEHILKKLLNDMLEMKTINELERFVVASTKLLQNCETGTFARHQYSHLVTNIQERFTDSVLKDNHWWTDYKYEIQQHMEKCTD